MSRIFINARSLANNLHRVYPKGNGCFSIMVDVYKLKVEHDSAAQEFFIDLNANGSDLKAVLQYERIQQDVLNMYHTEVPQELRGRGIAALLAKAAFDYVDQNDLKMQLTCSYLQKYIKDNPRPEYTSRIVE